jgi:hypothetical protein
MQLMSKSVSMRTNRKYLKNWEDWVRFLLAYWYKPVPDDFFMQKLNLHDQVQTINAFSHQCVTTRVPTLRASTVACVLSGIKSQFRANLLETTAFDHPAVRNVKVALNLEERKNDPLNVATQQKLPMTLGMTLHIANQAEVSGDIDSHMTAAAIQLGFACLLRVGEYVARAMDIDDECCHAMLVADVWFEVTNAAGTGSDFYCACDVAADMWDRVLLVKMSLRHMKNDRLRLGSSFWYKNYRDELSTVNIVKVVFDWAVRAQLGPEDFLFSHYQNWQSDEVRPLTVYMVETTIRKCAAHYGLDPMRFGTHSPRVGGATTLRAGDASQSTVMHAARWRSGRAALTYQDASTLEFDRIQFILQDASLYTTNDLRILQDQRVLQAVVAEPRRMTTQRTGRGGSRGRMTTGRGEGEGQRATGRGAGSRGGGRRSYGGRATSSRAIGDGATAGRATGRGAGRATGRGAGRGRGRGAAGRHQW